MAAATPVHGVAEVSFTSGTGAYTLSGATTGNYRFQDRVPDGASGLLIKVTDTAQVEYAKATFTAPDILTPTEIVSSSNGDAKVSWPASGQRIVELLVTDPSALLPPGGNAGDQLRKASDLDYDARWEGSPYPIAVFLPGLLNGGSDATRTRARILTTEAVAFPGNFAGSYFAARVTATGAVTFAVNQVFGDTTVAIGSLAFAAGGRTGALATLGGAAVSMLPFRMIELLGPSVEDLTLADIAGTFRGRRL